MVLAAGGHLDPFAPQTPYAAWEALYKVGFKGMGLPVILTSCGALALYLMLDQAWLLLVACFYLLGLLVASTVAFWLCLLRTYGGGGERRRENSSSGESIIDGLAYLYSRLLYEYAARFLADADAGMQQLDTDSSSLE
ncbi:unnamed protein product [Miscanthus lutarioriparius]|uniref:DUF7378 domain-containing protein n=1 Tax=Miscanthus lutarioriparius TaxID=422564 RepID=A0A811NIK8_9POAL|nr:unnamed protein product [Miscanthus lutarioriparius]